MSIGLIINAGINISIGATLDLLAALTRSWLQFQESQPLSGRKQTNKKQLFSYCDGDSQPLMIVFDQHHLSDGAYPLGFLQHIWVLR